MSRVMQLFVVIVALFSVMIGSVFAASNGPAQFNGNVEVQYLDPSMYEGLQDWQDASDAGVTSVISSVNPELEGSDEVLAQFPVEVQTSILGLNELDEPGGIIAWFIQWETVEMTNGMFEYVADITVLTNHGNPRFIKNLNFGTVGGLAYEIQNNDGFMYGHLATYDNDYIGGNYFAYDDEHGEVITTFLNGMLAMMLEPWPAVNQLRLSIATESMPDGVTGSSFFLAGEVQRFPNAPIVWPSNRLEGGEITINDPIVDVELIVQDQTSMLDRNIGAGTSNTVLQFTVEATEDVYLHELPPIRQIQDLGALRSVSFVSLRYRNYFNNQWVVTDLWFDDEQLTPVLNQPAYLPDGEAIEFSLSLYIEGINQTYGAFTGDLLQLEMNPAEGFIVSEYIGSTPYLRPGLGGMLESALMCVRGSVPTLHLNLSDDLILQNGQINAGMVEFSNAYATGQSVVRFPFFLQLEDAVETAEVLNLSNFQVWEGSSYDNAVPLAYGQDVAYRIYNASGQEVSGPDGVVVQPTFYPLQLFHIVFYQERIVQPGSSKAFIVKTTASNVGTGGGQDVIHFLIPGEDMGAQPLTAWLNMSPVQYPGWGAVLQGQDAEIPAQWIISDMTGTNGNFVHGQYDPVSRDWFNGWRLQGDFAVYRTLVQSNDGPRSKQEELDSGVIQSIYPNPFNPATTITIVLPQAADLTVSVFDVLGRQVAELANGQFNAGQHAFTLDGSSLSSGAYFVQASASGSEKISTQKIMLMK